MKKIVRVLLVFSVLSSFLFFNNKLYAATPTWTNNAKFSRGVGNVCFWISSSASSYASNIRSASNSWVYTGWDNPIYMNEVNSNYATHIDIYGKASSQDSTLSSTTAAYISFWDSLMAI